MAPLLAIRDLRIEFETEEGIVTAVDGVSLHLNAGVAKYGNPWKLLKKTPAM